MKDESFKSGWDGGPSAKPLLDKKEGLNRFVWDLRHESMPGVPNVYIEASYRGHKVSPGEYSLELIVGGEEFEKAAEVLPNPLYDIELATYEEYDDFMTEMEANVTTMHNLINEMSEAREEIERIADKLEKKKRNDQLVSDAREVERVMKEWDEDMVQRKSKAYDDVENFENKFTANYMFLMNQTESGIPRVNEPNKQVRAQMDAKWSELRARANRIMAEDLPALNKKLWEAGVGAIWLTPARS